MSQDLKIYSLNRLLNPNVQFSVGNWTAFADAAATSPVDGTGGSPNSTITRTEATPLEGVASLLFTKNSGASRQGEGASTDILLQASDATKVFTLSVDYQITTGTYTEGTATTQSDLTWWFYDVTNAVMYQMTPSNINGAVSTTNQYQMTSQVQIPVGCLSARLIMFIPNTTDASCTLRFNNISFGRIPRAQGAIMTNLTTTTNTILGTSSNPTKGTATVDKFTYYRSGPYLNGNFNYVQSTTGSAGSGFYLWAIPSGLIIDTAALPAPATTTSYPTVGDCRAQKQDGTGFNGSVQVYGATTFILWVQDPSGQAFVDNTGWSFGGTNIIFSGEFKVPISGWGGNGTLGQDADTRVIAAQYIHAATGVTIPTGVQFLNFPNQLYDTAGAVTTGSIGTSGAFGFRAPVQGFYSFNFNITSAANATDGNVFRPYWYKNGAQTYYGPRYVHPSSSQPASLQSMARMQLNANDFVQLAMENDANISISGGTLPITCWFEAERISGPASIQASEIVTARYSTNAGQSISNNSVTIIDYEDKSYDDHNAVTTGAAWKFTCPRAGKVRINAEATLASNAGWAVGETAYLSVFKTGVEYGRGPYDAPATATLVVDLSVNDTVDVIAGDYIDIRIFQLSGGTIALDTTSVKNYVSINYVGGF